MRPLKMRVACLTCDTSVTIMCKGTSDRKASGFGCLAILTLPLVRVPPSWSARFRSLECTVSIKAAIPRELVSESIIKTYTLGRSNVLEQKINSCLTFCSIYCSKIPWTAGKNIYTGIQINRYSKCYFSFHVQIHWVWQTFQINLTKLLKQNY